MLNNVNHHTNVASGTVNRGQQVFSSGTLGATGTSSFISSPQTDSYHHVRPRSRTSKDFKFKAVRGWFGFGSFVERLNTLSVTEERESPQDSSYGRPSDRIWTIYCSKVGEYDKYLVEGWRGDMDGVVIFVSDFRRYSPPRSPIPHPNTGKPFLCDNNRIRTRELQAIATGLARSYGYPSFARFSTTCRDIKRFASLRPFVIS